LRELARRRPVGSALVYSPQSGDVHLNAWVTMFGAQALELAGGGETMRWEHLV
jgi:hypothetical protein